MGKNTDMVLIAAVARYGVIGNNGSIPWNIPKDMKRFKELTMNHPVLMGRMTYFSIPDKFRPLKGRTNIVLTNNAGFRSKIESDGAIPCYSIDEARDISLARDVNLGYCSEMYVIGGQKVYKDTIDIASRLELTEIDREYMGDAFFPKVDLKVWKESMRDKIFPDISFVSYIRR